jgi:hypothetical protein
VPSDGYGRGDIQLIVVNGADASEALSSFDLTCVKNFWNGSNLSLARPDLLIERATFLDVRYAATLNLFVDPPSGDRNSELQRWLGECEGIVFAASRGDYVERFLLRLKKYTARGIRVFGVPDLDACLLAAEYANYVDREADLAYENLSRD